MLGQNTSNVFWRYPVDPCKFVCSDRRGSIGLRRTEGAEVPHRAPLINIILFLLLLWRNYISITFFHFDSNKLTGLRTGLFPESVRTLTSLASYRSFACYEPKMLNGNWGQKNRRTFKFSNFHKDNYNSGEYRFLPSCIFFCSWIL